MKINETVVQLETTKGSHAFLVLTKQIVLIDTGMPGLAGKILTELQSLGISAREIQAILLTHHDVDHIGNAKQLQEATGAELWAPAEDVPYITGEKKRPGVKHWIEMLVRPQKPTITHLYGTDWPYRDISVLHAPGHTPGHTVFQIRDVVFTGDLFKFVLGRFRTFPALMNWDQEQAMESLASLRRLQFEWLCPSHGSPVRNGPKLQEFLAHAAKH